MTSNVPSKQTISTVLERYRTTAAYIRHQPSTGWAVGADPDQLKLSAMASAAA